MHPAMAPTATPTALSTPSPSIQAASPAAPLNPTGVFPASAAFTKMALSEPPMRHPSGIEGSTDAAASSSTLPPSTRDAQRSAQALAQLLRSADGIKRLNSLRPEERAELAAKVQAFQRQLQHTGGTPLPTLPSPSIPRPVIAVPPQMQQLMQQKISAGSQVRTVQNDQEDKVALLQALQRIVAQRPPPLGPPLIQQLLSQQAPRVNRPQTARPPTLAAQQLLLMLQHQRRGADLPLSEEQQPMEEERQQAVWPQPIIQQPQPKKTFSYEGRLDSRTRISRALERKKAIELLPNSVEAQICNLRKQWTTAKKEEPVKLSDIPLWDGCRFLSLSGGSICQVAMRYWWESSDVDDEYISVDRSGELPHSIDANVDIVTSDGTLDHPLDICVFPEERTVVAPMYPPALSKLPEAPRPPLMRTWPEEDQKSIEVATPLLPSLLQEQQRQMSLWVPQMDRDEFVYAKLPNPPDRFLQEVLRGKWHLSSDLMTPIPLTAYSTEKTPNIAAPIEVTPSGRPLRTARRFAGPYFDGVDLPLKAMEYDEFNVLPQTKRARRGGARTPQYSIYAGREPPSPKAEGTPLQMKSPVGEEQAIGTPSQPGTPASAGGYGTLDAEIDAVKRKTGWHPYVWYLMCRRPELYNIDIRARLVARVAGWEWDEIQKSPETLQIFLDRIWSFVEQNPVPRYTDKKEAKQYKNFAAGSVRTPWNGLETAAVRRALREMATSTGGDSDSFASDGVMSSSTGVQTPVTGILFQRESPTPLNMGPSKNEPAAIEGLANDSLPSLVAQVISAEQMRERFETSTHISPISPVSEVSSDSVCEPEPSDSKSEIKNEACIQ